MSCETYTPYAGDDTISLHKYGKLTYTSTCELTKLYIQERTRKGSPKGKSQSICYIVTIIKHKIEGCHQLLL